MSAATLAERYDVSKATIWRWSRIGEFPKPIKINGSTRWSQDDIESFEIEINA
jgi:predicted DNA-binding transcriptional regulator AlpA